MFKVKIVWEHPETGEEDFVSEYPVEEVTKDKVKFLPPTNLMKKDLLAFYNADPMDVEDAT